MKVPEKIRQEIEFDHFQQWFQSLSRSKQYLYGIPIICICVWSIFDATRPPEPDEPQQAIFWIILVLLLTVVLKQLLLPKQNTENQRPKTLGDFRFPTATRGRPVPIAWGRVLIDGPNVIWYGDLRQDAITKRISDGGWGHTRITVGFKYFIGMQLGLCRGPNVILRRVLIKKEPAFQGSVSGGDRFDIDKPTFFGGDEFGNGGVQATCDFYDGGDDDISQPVSPYLNVVGRQRLEINVPPVTEFDAPRYTGTAHVVVRELTSLDPVASTRGAYLGNSTNIDNWAFEVDRIPALFSGQTGGDNTIGPDGDVNPASVLVEFLKNREYGFNTLDAKIDIGTDSSFHKASERLIAEGNGFSMIVDSQMSKLDFIAEILRQIDGTMYIHEGKWTIVLARGADDPDFGYDIDTVPQFNESNITKISNFARGSWADTTNDLKVSFANREEDYAEDHATGQNTANAVLLGGLSVTSPVGTSAISTFPGVKDPVLAAALAWRDIRGQSLPLARGTFEINQQFWDLKLGDVVAWTHTRRNINKMPMRVLGIDRGDSLSETMIVQLVQDVFDTGPAAFAAPPPTTWSQPVTELVPYPADEQFAVEAPRAVVRRDPLTIGIGDPTLVKVFGSAARQTTELYLNLFQRNNSGPLSGGTVLASDNMTRFMLLGTLTSDLAAGTPIPTTLIDITAVSPATEIVNAALTNATATEIGSAMANLVYIDGEFMLVESVTLDGSNVDFNNVYRGVAGSAQRSHAAGADVFVLYAGAGLTLTTFPSTNNVGIELRPSSSTATYAGAATEVTFLPVSEVARHPYPVACSFYSGSATPFGTPDIEADGSGLNGEGVDVTWRRRSMTVFNEVTSLLNDIDPGLTDLYQVRVYVDPDGSNDLVFDSGFAATLTYLVTQVAILNKAAAGTEVRFQIDHRHTDDGDVFDAALPMIHDVVPTSSRTGQFYLGGDLTQNQWSNTYTAAMAGTFTVNIGASGPVVEYRINGGSATVVIAAGTTGTIPGVFSSDTIELRRTNLTGVDPNFLELVDPSAADVAYGVLS